MVEKAKIDLVEKRGRVRQGLGKHADMDDLRNADKKFGEETKEEIMAAMVEEYPRAE